MKRLLVIAALLATGPAFAAEATLAWDDVPNETTYHVERATGVCAPSGLAFTEIGTVGENVLTFTDKGLAEGRAYCWRVKASNPAGSSPYSNLAGKAIGFTVPAAPTNLMVK